MRPPESDSAPSASGSTNDRRSEAHGDVRAAVGAIPSRRPPTFGPDALYVGIPDAVEALAAEWLPKLVAFNESVRPDTRPSDHTPGPHGLVTGWDHPASNPLADIQALVRAVQDRPYEPFVPVLSAANAARYRRAVADAKRRDRFLWRHRRRFVESRHLAPMHANYRRRTHRRSRR